MKSIPAKPQEDRQIRELQELFAKYEKEVQKLSARHKKEFSEFFEKYCELLQQESDDKWRKNMVLCIISAIIGIAAGVGIGYFIWGRTKILPQKQPELTQKQLMRKEMENSLPSKKDAMKVMELIECLYEIDQVE